MECSLQIPILRNRVDEWLSRLVFYFDRLMAKFSLCAVQTVKVGLSQQEQRKTMNPSSNVLYVNVWKKRAIEPVTLENFFVEGLKMALTLQLSSMIAMTSLCLSTTTNMIHMSGSIRTTLEALGSIRAA